MKLISPIYLFKEKIDAMTPLSHNSVLQRILCQALLLTLPVSLLAQENKPTIQQYVVIDNTADVYEGKQVVTRLKQGSTVWGFQENQGWLLIKIPGSSKRGWTQGTHLKLRQLDPQQAQQWKRQADAAATQVRKLASKKQYQSALKAARESVEEHRRLYGDEHPQTLNELIAVGWLMAMTGQTAEGRKQIETAVATQEALFAPNSPALAGAYHLAARFALDIDQDYALNNYQRLFDLYDKIYQVAPAENIRKHREIVTSLIRAGKYPLAKKYAEKTWKLVETNQLTQTETAFLVMSDQAAIAQRLNRSAEAARLYRTILELPTDQISGQARGLTHNLLGQVLISQDKRREAAKEWEQAL
ncbi:MAG: tetratricopeptide repeat protein, partial [Gimesia chilikensis]